MPRILTRRPGRASISCIGLLALLLAAAAQADEETDLFFKESEAWRESAIHFATGNLSGIEARLRLASAGKVSPKAKTAEFGKVTKRGGFETFQYAYPNAKEKTRIVAAWKAEKEKVTAQLALLKSKKGWARTTSGSKESARPAWRMTMCTSSRSPCLSVSSAPKATRPCSGQKKRFG